MGDRETLNKIFAIMRNLLIVPMDGLDPIPCKGTTKRECYRALWEIQELLGARSIGRKHIAQTNADHIRAMSDEELAAWLEELAEHSMWSWWLLGETWLDWLKQEVDSDPT